MGGSVGDDRRDLLRVLETGCPERTAGGLWRVVDSMGSVSEN